MLRTISLALLLFQISSCSGQNTDNELNNHVVISPESNVDSIAIQDYFAKNQGNDLPSEMVGMVSRGKLINGKLMPFYGENFTYFDKDSYIGARAFTSDVVKRIILNTYDDLLTLRPERHFFLMELSNYCGGKISPHITHQNGLSVDFMMPKLKGDLPDYSLDTLGKQHYMLDFDNNGRLKENKEIRIDFNLIAQQLLLLEHNANKLGYKIGKVIIKIEYKDDLFASEFGRKLQKSGIYIVQGLSPVINQLHDDHFHIDFEKI